MVEGTDLCGQEAGKGRRVTNRGWEGLQAHLREEGAHRQGQREEGSGWADREDPELGWAPLRWPQGEGRDRVELREGREPQQG